MDGGITIWQYILVLIFNVLVMFSASSTFKSSWDRSKPWIWLPLMIFILIVVGMQVLDVVMSFTWHDLVLLLVVLLSVWYGMKNGTINQTLMTPNYY